MCFKQSINVDNYLRITANHVLEQLINSPTRGNSCLDHVFCVAVVGLIGNVDAKCWLQAEMAIM